MGMFVCSCASMISVHAYTHHSANLWRVCTHVTYTYMHKDGCGFVGVVERREKREWVCLFVHVQA